MVQGIEREQGMAWSKLPAISALAGEFDARAREAGDEHAERISAAWLYERYLEEVHRYVLRRVPSVEECEDITAEVFAAAFLGLPRFRGQCSPYLWLLGIARRKIALALRRRAARRETL